MQTLNEMSEAELLAWAMDFRKLALGTNIGKMSRTPVHIGFGLGELPPTSVNVLMLYGAQRKVNDSTTAASGNHDDKVKAARLMVDQLRKGIAVRQRGETVDPFQVILLRVIRLALKRKNPDLVKQIDALKTDEGNAELMRIFNAAPASRQAELKDEATTIRRQQEELAKLRESVADEDSPL